MNISLDSDALSAKLYPFTATRQAADIRIGILTIREKWDKIAEQRFAAVPGFLAGNIIPSADWVDWCSKAEHRKDMFEDENLVKIIARPWEIFKHNDWALRKDFELITKERNTESIPESNKIINSKDIFIELGAKVEHCIINATEGPVYIGKNATIMEGSLVRGPVAICEGAIVKMGTKIYGATTVGPFCTVGGEIKNSVLFGYSNKAHDGYLGDSVLGEWCNLGAGTSNSNVKNTAGEVKYWIGADQQQISAGNKGGLLMGDYSKAAINTSFNTGTIVGVCCNVFAAGLTPTFIPDFCWGADRTTKYKLDKALADIDNWKKLKGLTISEKEKQILTDIYKQP
jgi:UDP-N-acetylglucosamine diphosphorylase / glucose-1-phosphate thymidylyltransferase / UDP-N-acetylgalactosamine diphosphorylase / glucosamine-1-phosphate N-acetyltransferase / galactosamine-1-phosphate N-acetyltransferase